MWRDDPSVAERWVSQQEAMRLLGVSCSTVARWARTGRLPATRAIRGRRYDVGGVLEEKALVLSRVSHCELRDL